MDLSIERTRIPLQSNSIYLHLTLQTKRPHYLIYLFFLRSKTLLSFEFLQRLPSFCVTISSQKYYLSLFRLIDVSHSKLCTFVFVARQFFTITTVYQVLQSISCWYITCSITIILKVEPLCGTNIRSLFAVKDRDMNIRSFIFRINHLSLPTILLLHFLRAILFCHQTK